MVFPFGRRRPSPRSQVLDRMHGEIVGAVRRPAFYIDHRVPDTFEGRFELLALHAGLVLRRLNRAEAPGPAAAQDLVDTVFGRLDADLREAGVGDMAVPKRMKRLCEAFLGRSAAYDAALPLGEAAMAEALGRNVYAGAAPAGAAEGLARYALRAADALEAATLPRCLDGPLPFPDPALTVDPSRP